MKVIHMHGQLAEMVGQDEFLVDVQDARSAFSWLFAMFPKTKTLFKDQNWNIFYGDPEDEEEEMMSLDSEEFALSTSRSEIHIAPEVCGLGGGRGVVKTVIGVIIVAVATYFSAGSLTAPVSAAVFGASFTYGSVAFIGAAIALSGIAQMLTPIPDMSAISQQERNEADKRPSYLFNSAVNVVEEGGAIPVIYGTHRTGSTVISSGVEIEQIVAGTAVSSSSPPPATGTTGGTATAGAGAFKEAQDKLDNAP